MDKDVLIRFIQAIEAILGRLNSKRLSSFFALLVFFCYAPSFDLAGLAACLWLVLLFVLNRNPKGDGLA